MEYFGVFDNIYSPEFGVLLEQEQLSPAYPTYEEAYDDFVELGGLEANSTLTIETLVDVSLEEEMNC